MPSPFPGMDPYLEDPGLWPDVHHGVISEMQAVLNRLVRPNYHVRIEERVYVFDESDPASELFIPDLKIRHREGTDGHIGESGSTTQTSVAEPIVAITFLDDEIHESFLKIVDRSDRSVVTVIEVLSPTNKFPGSEGMRSYREKRREVMTSSSHFVEIELLRRGARIPLNRELPPCDYLVHVSREDERPRGRLWPIRIQDHLPEIPIPLRRPDENVLFDLGYVLQTAYDRAGYDMEIDYAKPPVPELAPETARWADELLKSAGLR